MIQPKFKKGTLVIHKHSSKKSYYIVLETFLTFNGVMCNAYSMKYKNIKILWECDLESVCDII